MLIFLRKFEYYIKILFFIINRISEFNKIIFNKIHLLLKYENLKKLKKYLKIFFKINKNIK
jgi:hypothetical protein